MDSQSYILSQVFGAGRSLPITYAPRENVDNPFLEYLSDDKHIVIHGPSGHGKSMLIKRNLPTDQFCVVQCSNYHKRFDVYRMILGEADASVRLEKTMKKGKRLAATISIFSGGAESGSETTEKVIDIDLGNINDIIRIMRENDFSKYVVLEDFHYLKKIVQKEILNDLKIVLDKSNLRFIFLGIWLQANKFLHLNGNLGGKLNSITVGRWEESNLKEVIEDGEEALNISFSNEIKSRLITYSLGCITILQELCYLICQRHGIYETQTRRVAINGLDEVDSAIDDHLRKHSPRFRAFLLKYATRGVRQVYPSDVDSWVQMVKKPDRIKTNINKWIVLAMYELTSDQLLSGVGIDKLKEVIDRRRGPKLTEVDKYQLIRRAKRVSRRQRKMNIHPLMFSFDNEEEKLHITDVLLLHFLSSEEGNAVREIIEAVPDNESEYLRFIQEIDLRRNKLQSRVRQPKA